ncbi:bifunctional 2-polyprenyl-6-hydroxyphenol methylase/3-demethylubiquinol 3-O-methyltransferase UbiG [Kitasatospora aureofaciens]|uniref:class I SAM-dependent methyltransferase n=1 Tax=Kitasatospora aureofaciens TaxID=1894 RepID=UPI001C48185E|nr:class I SAM-dependent methyltransferase [Kitasatospora aureofaciens]MBV6700754.1 class I SAM-dependent methyltransferase [Kitasatospora aureofaciens]
MSNELPHSGQPSNERRNGYDGTGAGAITPDGCAVEVWSRLPVGDAPDVIESAVPAGASILELGCGVGRMTHPLVDRGFAVTAVDESAEMLARVRESVRTVRSPIERLDLGERFDVVMLASFLVHAGDVTVRQGLLETCRRHVADDGCVLVQREGEDWHLRVPRESKLAGTDGVARVASATPNGDGSNTVYVEYEFPDGRWSQTFLSRPLSTEEFEGALAEAGLAVERYLTEDRTWVRARPVL